MFARRLRLVPSLVVFGVVFIAACGGGDDKTGAPDTAVDDHGDTADTETLIEIGEPTPGFLWETPESDWFRFRLEGGAGYTVEIESKDFQFSSFSVWRPNGGLVDRKPVLEGRIDLVPTASGIHTLRIFSPDSPAESGNYTVTVKKIADDHGNNRGSATELVLGLPEPGLTDFNGDVDMFSFEANEGWFYELKKSGFAVEEFWLEEFQPYTGPKEDDNFDSVITWSAPSTGKFYYQVFGVEPETTYTVTISGEPDDHVDLAGEDATTLAMNGLTQGRIQFLGDTDVFRFEAQKDWVYSIGAAFNGESRIFVSDGSIAGDLNPGNYDLHRKSPPGSFLPSEELPEIETGPYRQRPDWADDSKFVDAATGFLESADTSPRSGLVNQRSGFSEPGYRVLAVTPAEFRDASFANEPIAFKAPETGTYFLYVSKISARSTNYTVSITGEPDDHGDNEIDATAVALERNDSGGIPTLFGEAFGKIQIPEGPNGGFYDPDYFGFDLEPDWFYQVEAELGSMNMLTLTEVSNGSSSVSVTASKSPKKDDPEPVIELSPVALGKATILVSSTTEFGILAYHSGTYTLKVTAELDDHGNSAAEATVIDVGATQPGKIQGHADEDWFAFEAREGVKYDIFADLISLERVGLDLVGPGGNSRLETKTRLTDTDGDPKILDWVAPSSRTYYLSVWNLTDAYPDFEKQFKKSLTGTYTVTVTEEREATSQTCTAAVRWLESLDCTVPVIGPGSFTGSIQADNDIRIRWSTRIPPGVTCNRLRGDGDGMVTCRVPEGVSGEIKIDGDLIDSSGSSVNVTMKLAFVPGTVPSTPAEYYVPCAAAVSWPRDYDCTVSVIGPGSFTGSIRSGNNEDLTWLISPTSGVTCNANSGKCDGFISCQVPDGVSGAIKMTAGNSDSSGPAIAVTINLSFVPE